MPVADQMDRASTRFYCSTLTGITESRLIRVSGVGRSAYSREWSATS